MFGHSSETSSQKHPSNTVVLSQRCRQEGGPYASKFSAMIYHTTVSVQQVWMLKFKKCFYTVTVTAGKIFFKRNL